MSGPEMALQENFLSDSKRHYGLPVDMWNLGCIIYNMVCGIPPFEGEKSNFHLTLNQKEQQWKTSVVSNLIKSSPKMFDFVEKCLIFD